MRVKLLANPVWRVLGRMDSLRRFVRALYDHTVPGGVWINSDVCGPVGQDRTVHLRLATTDGVNPPRPRADLAAVPPGEVAAYVGALSTRLGWTSSRSTTGSRSRTAWWTGRTAWSS